MTPNKLCPRCGERKPATEFHRNLATKDGLSRQCKACVKSGRASWYRRNRDRAIREANGWIEKHREKFNARQRRNSKKPTNMEAQRSKQQGYRREMKPAYVRGLAKQSGVSVETIRQRIIAKRARRGLVFLMSAGEIVLAKERQKNL